MSPAVLAIVVAVKPVPDNKATELPLTKVAVMDGQGIEASKAKSGKHTGHGLANMADRAARMGAQLAIESSHEGTCVRLIFQR
jgi:nitrate/nitrite-specific signal transduction histidine kinase